MNWINLIGDKAKKLTQNNNGELMVESKGNKGKAINQLDDGTIKTETKVGNKSTLLSQNDNGELKTEVTNKLQTGTPLSPEGLLDVEIMTEVNQKPRTIGSDNFLYSINTGNGRVCRTDDGFETVEYGYDFKGNGMGDVESFTKTKAGYVAYINHDDGSGTASVWFSDSFTSGFSKVVDLTNGHITSFIPRPIHNIGLGVLMVGEYNKFKDPERLCRVWISKSGGAPGTWQQIFEVEAIDTQENFHVHGFCYDPFTARIYVSNGDYDNRKLQYSDDMGATWNVIDTVFQPTVVEVLPKRIVITPDANAQVGIMQIHKQTNKDYSVTPKITTELIAADIPSYGNFGRGPVGGLFGGNEMYITFPESGSGVRKSFVCATGDGGESWHLVATIDPIDGVGLTNGVVSCPNTGFMYGEYLDTIPGYSGYKHLAKIKPLNWESL